MSLLDYSSEQGDEYHKVRHSEIFANSDLLEAWGCYSASVYFGDTNVKDSILEVGAGTGINLLEIVKTNTVHAVEPSEYARSHCESIGIEVFPSLGDLPVGMVYDRILIRHVLEHVAEPKNFLCSLEEKLSPNGKIVIVVPSEKYSTDVDVNDIDYHLHCWNRQTLWNLVKESGLTPLKATLNWYNGRQILLPVLKLFGSNAYVKSIGLLGWVRRASEIIVVASK